MGDEEWVDYDDHPSNPPEVVVYPTEEDDPEPALWLPDGTPLYRHKPTFGFTRSEQQARIQPSPRRKPRRRRMGL